MVDEDEKEKGELQSSSSLHNGPTSVWIPTEDSSIVSSLSRGVDESIIQSVGESPSIASGHFSNPDDLHFAKRLSGISNEAQQQALTPAKVLESKRKSEQALPVSRLRFSYLGLVGRDEEIKVLESCLKRVASAAAREVVLILGSAGTGKTALATALMKPVKRLKGLYVQGKFDLYLRDEPYAGISAACREVCGRILQLQDEKAHGKSFEKIRDELIDKLGAENLHLLINIIPELSEIVGSKVSMDEMKKQGSVETKARVNYAFRILMRVVASNFAPLVVLLDDIQWSDAATLDLLEVLVTDRDNSGLMVIGVYRSNEVNETHLLSRLVRELKHKSSQDEFTLTEIEIGNLNPSQVNQIIMRLLSIDDPTITEGLADVCHKRSYGNVFSLLVFLEMLKAEGLLHYSVGRFKWGWNEQQILAETAATANVVDLLKHKIGKLPENVGERLSVASCLGFSFEPAMLDIVWGRICQLRNSVEQKELDGNEDENKAWIHLVEEEGFLEPEQNSTTYRWVHDKVQEAATSLVPPTKLLALKAQMGQILISELDDKDLDSNIFTVVKLLHEGSIPTEQSKRIELAQLSLQASKKACDFSAFESAGKFAAIGVQVLSANQWLNHYKLTLDLYSTAAEVAGYLGKTEEMERYYNEVLDQTDRPLSDKLRVYLAMISYMAGALGRPKDAIDLLIKVLAQLGIKFPKRKGTRLISTLLGAFRAKRRMSALTLEDIASLPTMNDPDHLEKMLLLDKLFIAAYLADSDLMPLAVLASVRLTLEKGLSEYSAPAFACLALFLGAAFGDMSLASKTGTFGRLAMANVECKNTDSRTSFFLHAFVFCWTEPITKMLSPLLRSYEVGLSVGDNEDACWSIAQYIVICFQSGKPLETVAEDCRIYSKQMREFKRETAYVDIRIYLEAIENLIGCSEEGNTTTLKSEEHFLSQKDHTVLGVFYSFKSILYLYFGEYEKGANLAIERGDTYAKGIPGHVWIMIETFARGMSLYEMARQTKKRIYKKHAKKVHKTIKSWVRQGNPNVKHYDLLFNAELAALKGNLDAAEGWYQSAIVSATRQGRLHESALASERYGDFLVNERNDREEAKHKFNEALQRYMEWGAAKKVESLREKVQYLWEKPTEIIVDANTEPFISKLGFSKEFTISPVENDVSQTG